jgi:hypothetical protein
MSGPLQIRGRGNSTWGMPKKPYRVKLTDKQSLLGMPSSKDWVLLANYSDKSLLRNALAMELGTRMGMPWTPRSGFVELYLNERYDGVYLLSENIKVSKDRVNIDQLAAGDVSADKITGGYLLEVDFRQDGHTMFSSIDQLPIVFQDPEDPVQAQEDYINGYINQFETALHSSGFADPTTGYAAYIDVDSFVRWFLVNELFRNVDANMGTSCCCKWVRCGISILPLAMPTTAIHSRRTAGGFVPLHGSRVCSKIRRLSRASNKSGTRSRPTSCRR